MARFDFRRAPRPGDARIELAEATRQIIGEVTSSADSSPAFERARDLVEQALAELRGGEHGRSYTSAEASIAGRSEAQEPGAFLDYSPIVGPLNPLAAPLEVVRRDDGTIIGTGRFGGAYEGPPGCVHGGFIAAGFDEMCGFAMGESGVVGMTVRLEVSYRSPTPLDEEVTFAARLDRVDGRKIYTTATLHHGDRLCAEATGLFVSMDPAMFIHLKQTQG